MHSANPTRAGVIACAIAGASGRMGQQLLAQSSAFPTLSVIAGWVSDGSDHRGRAAAGTGWAFTRLGESDEHPQVVIDFTGADGVDAVVDWCRRERIALVSGSTGLTAAQHARLAEAGADIPVLWSANFSLGVAVLVRAVAEAARALPGWDAEIIEAHHGGKRDAPSGTALALGRALAQARGQALDSHAVFDRHDLDRVRESGQIGFASVRAGDIVGEHTVLLASAGERLELAHRATDRAIFARGALHAAVWLAERAPALYRFEQILD